MRSVTVRFAVASFLSAIPLVAVLAAPPVPPIKAGLWQAKVTALDANGQVTVSPEQAALARMSPEMRARMAEAMKGRGVQMPDADGTMKICLTKEMFESGSWQQAAADSGCTTTYSSQTGSSWKWHSTCTSFQSTTDGEAVFTNPESYRTKMTTTATVNGKTTSVTRAVEAKWLSADCGDVRPLIPNGRGR
jgi:hypothetical protein